jgi:hypothetical protein
MIGTSLSITVFPLSALEGGDSRITGFTKIVWDTIVDLLSHLSCIYMIHYEYLIYIYILIRFLIVFLKWKWPWALKREISFN